jgi:hypothetical protein
MASWVISRRTSCGNRKVANRNTEGLARRERKWSLNEGQIPNSRGVRVGLGTGYNPDERNRRASRNSRVSSSPTRIPNVTIRDFLTAGRQPEPAPPHPQHINSYLHPCALRSTPRRPLSTSRETVKYTTEKTAACAPAPAAAASARSALALARSHAAYEKGSACAGDLPETVSEREGE